jgi:hypothetical protein
MALREYFLACLFSIIHMNPAVSSVEQGHGTQQPRKTTISWYAAASAFQVHLQPSPSLSRICSKRKVASWPGCRSKEVMCASPETAESELSNSRGHFLLRKYQQVRGIYLPRLSEDEEALFAGHYNKRPAAGTVQGTVSDSGFRIDLQTIRAYNATVWQSLIWVVAGAFSSVDVVATAKFCIATLN